MRSLSPTHDDLETLVSSLSFGTANGEKVSGRSAITDRCGFLKHPFVGRDEEATILLQAFKRIRRAKAPSEVVVIHGISGCGKTCLVEQVLRDHVVLRGGYFVMGKADQVRRSDPYSEIITALSDLIDLYSQNGDEEERREEHLLALENELRILLPLLPGLSFLLSIPSLHHIPASMESSSQAFTRFKLALRTLLKTFSCVRHPIVVFFDDIQWMDQSSRSILEFLIKDTTSQNILFICAYRDHDQDNDTNDVCEMFAELGNVKTAPIRDLVLQNLTETAINKLLQIYLEAEEDEVAVLAQICFTRTLGNCFFLFQFLNHLKNDGLLQPPFTDDSGWTWDTTLIQSCSVATENVLSILQTRMSTLSKYTSDVLSIASNLGFQFSLEILGLVVQEIEKYTLAGNDQSRFQLNPSQNSTIHDSIDEAIRKGFVECLTASELRFTHDQLQTFFFKSIEQTEHREFLNLAIGQVLKGGMKSKPELVFQVADHLNLGLSLLHNQDDRMELAQINLVAAKASVKKSAFIVAAEYVTKGLIALDHESGGNMWNDCHKLAIDLHTYGAKIHSVTGQFESCKSMIESVMTHAQSFDEKFAVLIIQSELLLLERKPDESIQTCVTLARELGEKLPRKPNGLHVLRQLMRTRRALWGLTTEKIANLPLMKDKRLLQIAEAFFRISNPCFFGGDPLLGSITSLRFVEIAVKHGISSIAVTSFGLLSVMEVLMGRIDKGCEYALLTHRLIDDPRLEAEKFRSRVYSGTYGMTLHWKRSMSELIDPLQKAYVDSFNTGDVGNGGLTCSTAVSYQFYCGAPLSLVETHLREASKVLKEYNQEYFRMFIMPFHQMVLNLRGEASQPAHLNGEALVYSDYLARAHEMKHRFALSLFHKWRLTLAFLFGSVTNAQDALLELDRSNAEKDFNGHCNLYFFHFYAAMTHYGLAQKALSRRRRRVLRRSANKRTRCLVSFARKGCENVLPLLAMLEAEKQIGELGSDRLIDVFEEAMVVVRNGPYKLFLGVCCEHLAMALTNLDDGLLRARTYLEAALEHYFTWEAEEKANQMDMLLSKLSQTARPILTNFNVEILE